MSNNLFKKPVGKRNKVDVVLDDIEETEAAKTKKQLWDEEAAKLADNDKYKEKVTTTAGIRG